jgi:hypothetical protein
MIESSPNVFLWGTSPTELVKMYWETLYAIKDGMIPDLNSRGDAFCKRRVR